MKVLFEESCSDELQSIFNSAQFVIVKSPEEADIILFQNHNFDYVKKTTFYSNFKEKCFVITETDRPNFFLPGIYVSNYSHVLSKGRAKTYCYCYTNRGDNRNKYVDAYQDKQVEKKFLFSFIGTPTCSTRRKLFRIYNGKADSDFFVCSSNNYNHWNFNKEYEGFKNERQELYVKNIKESLFYLCPRGAGHSSIRLFEVMELGVCPVIIADGWIPPEGPDWNKIAIFIEEREIPNIKSILEARKNEALIMGKLAKEAYSAYFSEEKQAEYIYQAINELVSNRRNLKENSISTIFPVINMNQKINGWLRSRAKSIALLLSGTIKFKLNKSTRTD